MSFKITIASLASLGVVGISFPFLYKNLSDTTVKEVLANDSGLKVLDRNSSDNQEWNKIIETSKSNSKESQLKAFIDKYQSEKQDESAKVSVEKLKDACENALKEKASTENVQEAGAYCTITA